MDPFPDFTEFVIRLVSDLPILTAFAGDRILVRLGHIEPVTLIRSLPPNYGAIAEAVAQGQVRQVYPVAPNTAEVMRLLASASLTGADLDAPRPRPSPPPPRRTRLLDFPHRD